MRQGWWLAGVLALGLGSAGAWAAGPVVDALAGRYARHFQNGLVDGSKYWSDDVVEIVPVAPEAAYVRASLQFFNGDSCDVSGVARAEGDALVYRQSATPLGGGEKCVLRVSHAGADLKLEDVDGFCRAQFCGARGMLDWSVPFRSRKPIGYLARLKGSEEFRGAMAEWGAAKAP